MTYVLVTCTLWLAGVCANGPNRIHDVYIIGDEISCPTGERLRARLNINDGTIEIWCEP